MNNFTDLEEYLSVIPPVRLWRYSAFEHLIRPSPEETNIPEERIYFIKFDDTLFVQTERNTIYGNDPTCRFYLLGLEIVKFHFWDDEETFKWNYW